MARTKQTARVSTGGKAPRKAWKGKGGKGIQSVSSSNWLPASSQVGTQEETNKMEIVSDVTSSTSFYAHYFDGGIEDTQIFKANFSSFTIPKFELGQDGSRIQSEEKEYWMGVNLNSKLDGEGIKKHGRPVLDLVIMLDISGSMSSAFVGEEEESRSKLDVAKDAVKSILSRLKEDDSLGIILFESSPHLVLPITRCSQLDKIDLEKQINSWRATGGTNITEAFEYSSKVLKGYEEREGSTRRIFALTDMEVNINEENRFLTSIGKNSGASVWSTVIGIGHDLSVQTIEKVSSTPGANYGLVRSSKIFNELIEKEFEHMVTPIAFNIKISTTSTSDFEIEKGFGSPEVEVLKRGEAIAMSTEFPSLQNEKGERKGGILLFKLITKAGSEPNQLVIEAKHEDNLGITHKNVDEIKIGDSENLPVRKAVALVRFTQFVKEYIAFRAERIKLGTVDSYKKKIEGFKAYFAEEKDIVKDDTLSEELTLLDSFLDLEPKDKEEEKKVEKVEEKKEESPKRALESNEELENEDAAIEQSPKVARVEEEKEKEGKEDIECVVCLSEKKEVMISPCNHLCLCKGCSNNLKKSLKECPICRTKVKKHIVVYG
eukprot:TRINITY_DN3553_c0_g3_i1.p1 TRINITY_DN3553_c0_g3~~TRINITY_DN3553_c0_g3_i1.p1  ORF type:complete len:603 (-),score=245.46 TRINITY_DN3553_c0_g3_i1:95-1903(-)